MCYDYDAMRRYLTARVETWSNDFAASIAQMDNLSVLREMNFCGTHVPDYRQLVLQQFYLLRYFPAYFTEYFLLYQQILRENFLTMPCNVLSLGAGNGVDYAGLMFAWHVDGNRRQPVHYTGIDKVAWGYQENFGNPECRFVQQDVSCMDPFETNANIVTLPMSIGEFDNEAWQQVLTLFSKLRFQQRQLILLVTLRAERSQSVDVPRTGQLVEVLQTQGFHTKDDVTETGTFGNVPFSTLSPGFCYPEAIRRWIGNLPQSCQKRNCRYDCGSCRQDMRYWPIQQATYAQYELIHLVCA